MPSPSSFVVASALVAGALALPPRIGLPAGSFSVHQVRNNKFAGRHGPLALAKAYNKFGAQMPDDLSAAVARITAELGLERRSTGSATTTPEQYDSEYLTPVSIGTPAQVLNLDFDTGSSDLWVFSSELPKSSINGQAIYTPSKSSTSKKLKGASWSISYGDGSSSSGDVYNDVVTVGGLKVSSQAVETAKTVSSEFSQDGSNDGLLGLAFSSINTVSPSQQNTFFDNAAANLDSPLFTADLRAGQPGKYNFGFIDSVVSNGSVTYTDVDSSQGFWMFTSPAFSVGSGSKTSTAVQGIADTGTTLLLLPDAVVSAYYAKVKGATYDNSQGGYVFACSTTPPTFSYYINSSAKITIPGEYMNFAPVSDGSTSCFGGIQSDSGIGFSIYGDVALKAALVVFDGSSSPRLGFAPKSL